MIKLSKIHLNLTLILLLLLNYSFAQETDYKYWSETDRLNKEDFKIKTGNLENSSSFAQFSFDYKINGFDFITKNFNKKVKNYMIKSASWLDTNRNVNLSLLYQQTLFDISEIYARIFRKQLKENRSKILKGTKIVEELNNKIMTDFSKRRLAYIQETNNGAYVEAQEKWEKTIKNELDELKQFAN